MGFVKEFKEFAVKGNVIDLAVGVIIGAAFGKIVDSVVNDLIMPIVAAIIGKPDFSNLYFVLKGNVPEGTALADARKIPDTAIFAYGNFITVLINFILLALIIFIMIKAVNNLRRKQAEAPAAEVPPAPTPTEVLLTQIRDELQRRP
jgi:large conductance mechanosensitive channel